MSALVIAREAMRKAELSARVGAVREISGLAIDCEGPDVVLGELCHIHARGRTSAVEAEVVALRPGLATLMPYGWSSGIAPGCRVVATGCVADVCVGSELLGRVIDGFGNPLDGKAPPITRERRSVRSTPLNPMQRPPIRDVLETGIRAIDTLTTLGKGQRVGIFAGSGVGKSTLLGQIARHVTADVNVIALIGERGREVREFIERHLGDPGLAKSVVVVATADQPALGRLRAALAAAAIAEYFRDRGQQVLLTMDSLTRFAMARREVGLAAGEPPTARGYTPSVFSELPLLCERCGTAPSGGAITALLTVLVEGDDFNEPIADAVRATLDGHIVLAREIAERGIYPAIDALRSTSRVMNDIVPAQHLHLARTALRTLGVLEQSRQLIDVGAYVPGHNAELDRALSIDKPLTAFLRQDDGPVGRAAALAALERVLEHRS